MYAVVRELYFDELKLAKSEAQLNEFQQMHKDQPGYIGNITVELAPGHQIVINLWQSESQSNAGREALIPIVQRLQEPMMVAPSRLLGAGPIIYTDIKV